MTLSNDGVKAGLDEAAIMWKRKHALTHHDGDMEACNEFDAKEAASEYVGIDIADLNVILEVTYEAIHSSIATILLNAVITQESPIEDLVQAGVDMAIATYSIGLKQILDERQKNVTNKYAATVMAEAHLSAYKAVDQNLDSIWPEAIVTEVAEQYAPGEAFLVGVLCGRASNG